MCVRLYVEVTDTADLHGLSLTVRLPQRLRSTLERTELPRAGCIGSSRIRICVPLEPAPTGGKALLPCLGIENEPRFVSHGGLSVFTLVRPLPERHGLKQLCSKQLVLTRQL